MSDNKDIPSSTAAMSSDPEKGETTSHSSVEHVVVKVEPTVPSSPPSLDHHDQRRVGHSCCFFGCDMRRAVIVINIINLIIAVIMTGIVVLYVYIGSFQESTDHDYLREECEEFYSDDINKDCDDINDEDLLFRHGDNFDSLFYCLTSVAMIAFLCGMVGAIQFLPWMVVMGLLGHIALAGSLFVTNAWSIFLVAFYAYPHFVLLLEMKRRIMTRERYPLERRTCCCG